MIAKVAGWVLVTGYLAVSFFALAAASYAWGWLGVLIAAALLALPIVAVYFAKK